MSTNVRLPKLSTVTLALGLALLSAVGTAQASSVLLDRGLPTANLNNISGASRSNVAWVDGTYTSSSDYWVMGDSFTNTSGSAWHIESIRVWTVGATTSASLWGGTAGGGISVVSAAGAISGAPVTYADSSTYQGSSGAMINMFQVDFAVDITLAAGDTYEFYLDGTGGAYTVPFLHASNAALSGSAQDGADNEVLGGRIVNGAFSGLAADRYTWQSQGAGWDKNSDFNVQVTGNVIPEPGSMALAGLALLGLAAARRRA